MGNVQARKNWELDNRNNDKIDVSGQGLNYTHIATIKFSIFRQLNYLNAGWNDIDRLPPKIGKIGPKLKRLTLSQNRLSALPLELENLTGLTKLEINKNLFTALPPGIFEKLPFLEELCAHMNKLTELPPEIGWAREMKRLTLYVNAITKLPEELGLCSNLNELDIATNKIVSLPDMFGRLSNMQRLNMSSNRLKVLGDFVGNLTQLDRLDLRFNELRRISPAIAQCVRLRSLNLAHNKLDSLPPLKTLTTLFTLSAEENKLTGIEEICNPGMSALSTLTLSSNCIGQIPFAISCLERLTTVNFNNNQIEAIPPTIGNLHMLQKLYVANNNVCYVPPEITTLSSLTELELQNNHLSSLPPFAPGLDQLGNLDLSNNFLTTLPESIGLLPKLRQISLDINSLTSLPETFTQLSQLVRLSCAANEFTEVPPCIKDFSRLHKLFFGYNNLTSWFPSCSNLTTLAVLCLSGNLMTEFPEGVTTITGLKELHLANNEIKAIPSSISMLTSLTILDLTENRLSEVPVELGACTLLTELELAHNQLTSAVGIAPLTALAELDMSGNLFTHFPCEVANLSMLKQLKMGYCNIERLSKEETSVLENLLQGALSWLSLEGNPCLAKLSPALRLISEKTACTKPAALVGVDWNPTISWAEMRGVRPTMEDTVYIGKHFRGNRRDMLIGLFDGHGGPHAAYIAAQQLSSVVTAALAKHNEDPMLALQATFFKLEEHVVDSKTESGCTAVVALFLNNTLWIASAGDSRAVISKRGVASRITTDHTGRTQSERRRIQDMGGYVTEKGRIMDDLAVARSLGDITCRPYVTCQPDIHKIPIVRPSSDAIKFEIESEEAEDSDPFSDFLILACDGVWDVLEDQEAVNIVARSDDKNKAAVRLRDHAFFMKSTDNISAVVVHGFKAV